MTQIQEKYILITKGSRIIESVDFKSFAECKVVNYCATDLKDILYRNCISNNTKYLCLKVLHYTSFQQWFHRHIQE